MPLRMNRTKWTFNGSCIRMKHCLNWRITTNENENEKYAIAKKGGSCGATIDRIRTNRKMLDTLRLTREL